jgi:(1->4)-alpha-D-glucan 1-alpha-D-glucosylmutase
LTAPGVPDIHQGTELWDLSLVDPDNRRPVDYASRRRLLTELDRLSIDQIVARGDEGLPKLWLIRQALATRRDHPEWFGAEGSYEPLLATGSRREHVVAFQRSGNVIGIAPRLVLKLQGDWKDTAVSFPPGDWRNVLTGERMKGGKQPLANLLRGFPVALLVREG